MQEFLYRGLDSAGQTRTGSVREVSIEAALEKLEEGGLTQVKLEPREGSVTLAQASAGIPLYQEPEGARFVVTVPLSTQQMHEQLVSAGQDEEDVSDQGLRKWVSRGVLISFLFGASGGASLPFFYWGWVPVGGFIGWVAVALGVAGVLLGRSPTRADVLARGQAFVGGVLLGMVGAVTMRTLFALYFWLTGLNWTLS